MIIYIVQRAIREEAEHLRGLNIVPDEPVSVNRNSGRLTGGNHVPEPPQDTTQVTFFTGLGTLVFAGVSGILKSASQLWSKDFGGGESVVFRVLFFTPDNITVVASMCDLHVCLR